jgi:NTE family protein
LVAAARARRQRIISQRRHGAIRDARATTSQKRRNNGAGIAIHPKRAPFQRKQWIVSMTHESIEPRIKKINLALQGGGAHGAFTWGVLDFLLEDERLEITGITGTSAGAMNAAVMVDGYSEDGRRGARRKLASFWAAISNESALSPIQRKYFDFSFGYGRLASNLAYWGSDWIMHYSSPYEFNPFNLNPLIKLVEKMVDFSRVRSFHPIKLFVAATNVHTGKVRIFKRSELTAKHVMASACLPTVFQAVVIDGEPYWDGGYMGNPPLFPLFYDSAVPDIVIVQINPIETNTTPRTPRDIRNRLNEITFNGALLGELRAIDFVNRLVDSGRLSQEDYMRPFVHRIDGGDFLRTFPASSKLDPNWPLLLGLFEYGRAAAKKWLDAHFGAIGQESTLDLRMAYTETPRHEGEPAFPRSSLSGLVCESVSE